MKLYLCLGECILFVVCVFRHTYIHTYIYIYICMLYTCTYAVYMYVYILENTDEELDVLNKAHVWLYTYTLSHLQHIYMRMYSMCIYTTHVHLYSYTCAYIQHMYIYTAHMHKSICIYVYNLVGEKKNTDELDVPTNVPICM